MLYECVYITIMWLVIINRLYSVCSAVLSAANIVHLVLINYTDITVIIAHCNIDLIYDKYLYNICMRNISNTYFVTEIT